ncbi:uncharacterized protein LOC120427848 [Culex pipiens pallens]|uniref:uncharacterized protein LOC120427848 n=1 Tax=Culex pipiens pallens TaxID=42434 RepID=UPI001952CD9B|nr:uncharacterized protein LOC120427848 [Culex pipiens pallens]
MSTIIKFKIDDLDEDEIDYELRIRDAGGEGSIETKKRELRALMRNENTQNYEIQSNLTLKQEYSLIAPKLKMIETNLEGNLQPMYESKLYHYMRRIFNAVVEDQVDETNKTTLLSLIAQIVEENFGRKINIENLTFVTTTESNPDPLVPSTSASGTNTKQKEEEAATSHNILVKKLTELVEQRKAKQQTVPPQGYVHISEIENVVKACLQSLDEQNLNQPGPSGQGRSFLNRPSDTFQSQYQSPEHTTSRSVIPNIIKVPQSVRRGITEDHLTEAIRRLSIDQNQTTNTGRSANANNFSHFFDALLNPTPDPQPCLPSSPVWWINRTWHWAWAHNP